MTFVPSFLFHPYAKRITIALLIIINLTVFYSQRHSYPPIHLPSFIQPHKPPPEPQWLLAILVKPDSQSRRAIIRSTWATRFPSPHYTYRFILGNYTSTPLAPSIDAENATHGDIISLPDYQNENGDTANHIKNLELFKYLAAQGRRWDFVSKVDADVWFNIPPYFETFIQPRLEGGELYKPEEMTMIGRPMKWTQKFAYASGRLYTLNWALLEFYVEKYATDPRPDKTEDEVLGLWLYEGEVGHRFVVVELEQAWDIGLEGVVGDDGGQTMMIHSIKNDERLEEVGTLFDVRGRWNGREIDGVTRFNRTMRELVERLGKPGEEEMEDLRRARERESEEGKIEDPWGTADGTLILKKIGLEDREKMGTLFPLRLPGNNASTGIVPRNLYRLKHPAVE